MSDVLTPIGDLTLTEVMPGVIGPLVAAEADLQARITSLLSFSATVGLDMSGLITLSAGILANLQAGLSLGLQAPSLSVQINAVVALTAAIQAQLQLIQDLFDLLGASVSAWAYDGTAGGFGAAIDGEFAGGISGGGAGQHVNALILATQYPAVWTTLGQIFRTTP